jgi:hypothetical protein
MALNKAAWDAALTDVGARLVALEAVRASFQALIDEGTGQALAVIQANVGPQLAALEASITTAQAGITTAQGIVNQLITDGVASSIVTFSPPAGMTSTNVQAAIAELFGDLFTYETASATSLKSGRAALRLRANIMGMV